MSHAEFARRVLILLALIALALVAWYLADVLLLAFGAVLFAILLLALARPLTRWTGLSQHWTVALTLLLLVGLVVGGAFLFGMEVRKQASDLGQQLPQKWAALKQEVQQLPFADRLLAESDDRDSGARGTLLSGIAQAGRSVVAALADFLLIVVAGLYLAAQPPLYRRGMVALFPAAARAPLEDTLQASGEALRWWLIGRLISMLLVGVLTGLGLWAIGMPSVLALGLIAALAEFVPLIGPIAAAIPAVLIAIGEDTTMVWWVIGLYFVVQQIEGNVITPLVQRRVVSLPPAVTLFAVVAFGVLFGPLGVLMATPLAVAAMVFLDRLWIGPVVAEDRRPDDAGAS